MMMEWRTKIRKITKNLIGGLLFLRIQIVIDRIKHIKTKEMLSDSNINTRNLH